MKFFIGLISIVFFINEVSSYCHHTLGCYYDCIMYGKKTATGYTFLNYNDDNFFAEKIKGIDTFQKAMDDFRRIFNTVKSCTGDACDCARYYLGSSPSNYTAFFNSSTLYPQMFAILNAVKTKYDLLSMDQISAMTNGYHFDEFYPAFPQLNEYCHQNEFSFEMNFFYQEPYKCEVAVYQYMYDCSAYYLNLNNYIDSYSIFSSSQLEQYTSCLANYLSNCDVTIQNSIILSHIYDFPQIIKGNNLTSYIQTLVSKKAAVPARRTMTFGYFIQLYSIKKQSQYCNFDAKLYNLFTTSSVKVTANAGQGATYKILNKITATFTFDKSTSIVYTASKDSFPTTFSNNNQVVNGANNVKWLEMIVFPYDITSRDTSLTSVMIMDYRTNTTVTIHDCINACNIEIIAPTQVYSGATGIKIDGCNKTLSVGDQPQYSKDQAKIIEERRKRSIRNFKYYF